MLQHHQKQSSRVQNSKAVLRYTLYHALETITLHHNKLKLNCKRFIPEGEEK